MRIRALNHSVYQTEYHIVWGTKYRRKLFKNYVKVELIKSFYKILRQHPDWYLHNLNTDLDHVHLLLEFPPKYSISEVVQVFKSLSSLHLRKCFKFIDRLYPHSGVWGTGYFVSTVGLNEKQIKQYIIRQGTQDRGVDITSEFS